MNIIGFIFARGGSKGLPGKNIKLLDGKPLIGWAIEKAKQVERIDRIIVSTDSKDIAKVAREFGAETPFMRPLELSTDNSSEWLAWQHALRYIETTEGKLPDMMLSIPTTAPLRAVQDINNCLDVFEKGGADVVITVSDSHRNPYFNMIKINNEMSELVNKPQSLISRRQDTPEVFDMTTVCYVASPKFVMSSNSIFEGRVKSVHVPLERAIDIDTDFDFKIAEFLLESKYEK
jgi:CMP-N-acetylneuraminic acid synthetase